MSDTNKKLFLSAVSNEFVSYRTLLAGDLKRPNLDVAVQEDFVVTGGSTLEKVDTYIRHCDAVVHLLGKAAGATPEAPAVAALLAKYPDLGTRLPPLAEKLRKPDPGVSYTQWEAYLAIYHERPLFVYRAIDFETDALNVPRGERFVFSGNEAQSQKEHYERISTLGHDRGTFLNEERLSSAVLRDLVEILPRLETTIDVRPTRLRHTAERLIGRDDELTYLDTAWNDPQKNVVIVRAFGGMGKTSLVATWMAELALKNWRGAERVFDWSFYSQGTREQGGASSDSFIDEALRAFGDPDPKLGFPWDRGARLAHLVSKSRCLLVLDGVEPLQHPPGPMLGKLKDPAIEALLKGLAAQNLGLCVVTTREKVDDIKQHYGRSADDFELIRLSDLAGAALLHFSGARRAGAKAISPDDGELRIASNEVRGHGLTLQLLGQYLRLVEDGDILKRDTVRLADADHEYQNDATRPYGHAFKAMEAYEKWFASAGEIGRRQLTVLRLLGLFDRPASKSCFEALRAEPVIAGLTESLTGVSLRDWKVTLSRLGEINLIAVQEDGSLDAHPLLREYFARQLRTQQPDAWRAAHRRLYEHLCATTPDKPQPTLEDLQPLYQAVAHGCQAGMQREACHEVYQNRILRLQEYYSARRLGAFGSDLGAIACFFQTPWIRVSPTVAEIDQGWLLNQAAFTLRALGRLTEALEPMRAALEFGVKQENWTAAAVRGGNLSELELTLGELAGAVADATLAVSYADRSGEAHQRMNQRAKKADALNNIGRCAESEASFREGEVIQTENQPSYPLLYSVAGFRYCDLLLREAERVAWQHTLQSSLFAPLQSPNEKSDQDLARMEGANRAIQSCRAVSDRAVKTLRLAEQNNVDLLSVALDHLSLGRAALYAAILGAALRLGPTTPGARQHGPTHDGFSAAPHELDAAVAGIRRAGTQHWIPTTLLTRAWLRFLTSASAGLEGARVDLDEAREIAERGPMGLHMADIHLYRARLFHGVKPYPWATDADGRARGPKDDLAAARKLIEQCGYWRRKEELEDAEAAAANW